MLVFQSRHNTKDMVLRKSDLVFIVLVLFKLTNGQARFATECFTPNNKVGYCIEVQECGLFLKQIQDDNKGSFDFIRDSRCGPPNEDISRPKVCCGPDVNYIYSVEKPREESQTVEELPSQSNAIPPPTTPGVFESPGLAGAYPSTRAPSLPASTSPPRTTSLPPTSYSVFPDECGLQQVFVPSRIVGGIEADIGEFPWLARLVHFNKYNKTRLGCSGFLIHSRFVLTAAHCVVGKGIEHLGTLQSVILGMHNDTKARICVGLECTDPPLHVKALRAVTHQLYDSENHLNDIALIALDININFTEFIRAICLPNMTANAKQLTISGWGRTETDATSKTKLKVELPRFNQTMCNERYKSLGLTISDMQICAGGVPGHDSCAGDSGGPLMAMDENMRWYAEGIVSYGNSCGRPDWPGVYTNIPSYYNWIVDNIRTIIRMNRNILG